MEGDPHIIVNGGNLSEIIEGLEKEVKELELLEKNQNYKAPKP